MQTEKFIRRAQSFVGDDGTVDRVVVIQQRPLSAILAGIAAFIVAALLLAAIGVSNVIIVGAVGGAALAGAMASMTKNFYLAGIADEVQMLQLATWTGQPEQRVKSLARPLDAEVTKGLINKSVEIDGQKYVLSRMFESEFDSLRSDA